MTVRAGNGEGQGNTIGRRGRRYFLAVLVCTMLMEGALCVGRFGLGVSMKEHEGTITRYTLGVRIHHGYVGAVVLLVVATGRLVGVPWKPWSRIVTVVAWSLVLSDAIHHFLVLYLITGATEFP